MPPPHDTVFVPEGTDSPEDPLGLFPSEFQKIPSEIHRAPAEALKVHSEVQKVTAEGQKAIPTRRARAAGTRGRRFVILTIASVVRMFAVLMAASRRAVRLVAAACVLAASAVRRLRLPRWRLPAWRVPALRLPTLRRPMLRLSMPRRQHFSPDMWHLHAWHLPKWPASRLPARRLAPLRLPVWRLAAWRTHMASVASKARPFATQIASRIPISGVTLAAFACGVVVGGSAVWLSGPSRDAGVDSQPSQQAPLDGSRVTASPIAPVGTALAKTVVVEGGGSQTAATTASAGARRALFRGSLVVNSRPSGARVFLNGRSVGQTPLVLRNQAAGSRAVRVALDGYEPWSSAVQVVADTETHLRAELKMQRPVAQP